MTYLALSGVVQGEHAVVVSSFGFDRCGHRGAQLTQLALPVPRVHRVANDGGGCSRTLLKHTTNLNIFVIKKN